MYEKVNPSHPDKVADRIAGALVDLAYRKEKDPRIAVEVLLGHGKCHIIAETSVSIPLGDVEAAVARIAGEGFETDYSEVAQDAHLAKNQEKGLRCGDNGIFKGTPVTKEQKGLTVIADELWRRFGRTDGKYVLDHTRCTKNGYGGLTVCQSHTTKEEDRELGREYPFSKVNPLGPWTGGPDVDSGATNRKLGSDMGDSVTGGGLHGKDLSKADVSVNIHAFLKAQKTARPVFLRCSIGDAEVDGKPYKDIVEEARAYIERIGGFEAFAEWGLIRP